MICGEFLFRSKVVIRPRFCSRFTPIQLCAERVTLTWHVFHTHPCPLSRSLPYLLSLALSLLPPPPRVLIRTLSGSIFTLPE